MDILPMLVELDIVQTLEPFGDDLKELRQFILVANRAGCGTKHQHRVPGDAVDGDGDPLLRAAVDLAQILKGSSPPVLRLS